LSSNIKKKSQKSLHLPHPHFCTTIIPLKKLFGFLPSLLLQKFPPSFFKRWLLVKIRRPRWLNQMVIAQDYYSAEVEMKKQFDSLDSLCVTLIRSGKQKDLKKFSV
jgi:hypothetical protein